MMPDPEEVAVEVPVGGVRAAGQEVDQEKGGEDPDLDPGGG